MSFKLQDPVTDTNYDFGDPAGVAMKMVMIVGGLTVTSILAGIAIFDVGPRIQSSISALTGGTAGGTSLPEGF